MGKRGLSNLLLVLGLLFIFAGFLYIVTILIDVKGGVPVNYLYALCVLLGLVFLYARIAVIHSSFCLFVAMTLILNGAFSILVTSELLGKSLSLRTLWPILMINTALSLFVAARVRGLHKMILSYDFPALVLLVLGIFYLLFSLSIIKIPLAKIAIMSAPLLLVLAGVFLILLFYKRKDIIDALPPNLKQDILDNEE